MRVVNLKCTEAAQGYLSVAHPNMQPGLSSNGVITYRIEGVPDDVPTTEVVRLANGTALLKAVTHQDHARPSDYTYDFADLGIGAIVRDAKGGAR